MFLRPHIAVKTSPAIILLALFAVTGCGHRHNGANEFPTTYFDSAGTTVKTRIKPPEGFHRVAAGKGSFAEYLQNLPLRPHGYRTHIWNGEEKAGKVACAVIDMPTCKDQQCADAVMRLRAEYLYATKRLDSLAFNLTNGFRCDYNHFRHGYRIATDPEETRTWWEQKARPDTSRTAFEEFLKPVFRYAGTASLELELKKVEGGMHEARPGDVIINGGFPGHACIIVDMIQNNKGEKRFLIAQSYTPAQEIEILRYDKDSPWHPESTGGSPDTYVTAEYTFSAPFVYTW